MTRLLNVFLFLVLSAAQGSPIDVSDVALVPPGEGIVFGRVKVSNNGELIDW
jgi:hypothetical protein